MAEKLTKSEERVYTYLNEYWEQNGYSPSVRDICSALDFASTSTVHLYLSRLEAKGYIEKEEGKSRSLRPTVQARRHDVPIIGTVRAGAPILAHEDLSGYIRYADATAYPKGSLFALRIVGDSMIEAGIMEGDIVIVCRDMIPSNGDIAVALIDDEATVKTFYKEDGHFRLQPENSSLSQIITDTLTVLGKVIACIREYV